MAKTRKTDRVRIANRFAIATTGLLMLAACGSQKQPETIERNIKVGNKTAIVRLSGQDQQHFGTVREITQRMMSRVAAQLNAHLPGSDIAQLNRIGNDARIQVSHDTFRLLDLAQHYSDLSGGAYNFTVVPLSYLWGFEGGPVPTNIPSQDAIQAALIGVGTHNISLFENTAAALTHTQARLSVDSLADAYAVDMAIVEARDKAILNFSIQIGLSMRSLGSPLSGTAWEWPLIDPFNTNSTLGKLTLNSGGISCALLREKTVKIGGKTYGHIIDPQTGSPAEGTAMAVVAGPSATKCCVLAQALIVTGADDASKILPRFAKCEAMIVPDKQPLEIWMTPGFAPRVKLNAELQRAVRHFVPVPAAAPPVKDDGADSATNAPPASPAPPAK